MNGDLPLEIHEARAKLVPELRELKRNNKDAWIAYPARLMVEGQEVRTETPKSRVGDTRLPQPGDYRPDGNPHDDYSGRGSNSSGQREGWRYNARGSGRGRSTSRGGSSRGGQ